jgi:uncharacterized SAM-binding protein YcdF (DUF218 family)
MNGQRLVAVLGYSDGAGDTLHEICAARLRRAEREVRADDVVLLSGWARGRRPASEAELMARAWNGRGARVLLDRHARSTLGNALGAAAIARSLPAREVLLVTSGWHARRAAAIFRVALRGSDSRVTLAVTDEPGSLGSQFREVACWALVPFAALAAHTR